MSQNCEWCGKFVRDDNPEPVCRSCQLEVGWISVDGPQPLAVPQ